MTEKLKVTIYQFDIGLSNRYINIDFPKRSKLFKGMKLRDGDFVEISIKKVKRRR